MSNKINQKAKNYVICAALGILLAFSTICNPDNIKVPDAPYSTQGETLFRRGDSNGDGRFDISDPVFTLSYLFLGGPSPTCRAAADTDADDALTISDSIAMLFYLFKGGPQQPDPFPDCGPNREGAVLTCDSYTQCDDPEPLVENPDYLLEICADPVFYGEPGATVSFDAIIRLSGYGSDVQAWSLGVSSDWCEIVDATTDGTVGADVSDGGLRDTGFEWTELTAGYGNEWAVSSVVLSLTKDIALDMAKGITYDLFRLTVEAVVPERGSRYVTVRFADGLRGSGQSVPNLLTVGGNSVKPVLQDLNVTIHALTWCTLTVDSSGNVGLYTSLALDSSDDPRISYFDGTNDNLKYASWNGASWDVETVDSNAWVGVYPSLALDSADNPRISYYDDTNGDLKYASRNGSSWDIQIIDSNGRVGMYTSLALDSGGNPAIAYQDNTNGTLKYSSWDSSSSTWDIEIVDSNAWVGFYLSLDLDSADNPSISYRDWTNGTLKYASRNGSSWDIETVDDSGDVGYSTSLAMDGSGNPHISYRDNTNLDLKYASWNSSSLTWDTETVDSNGDAGRWTSLALDSNDYPRISYHDNTNGDLKYASFNGLYWTIQTIDSSGDVGDYTSLVLDSSGKPRISYYDKTNGDLKLAVTCVSMPGDLNADCYVDFVDFAEFAGQWLECSVPFNPDCVR